ncbi:MAG: hypothetical protein AAF458_18660 [Pseudomonadota bacterium]
MKAIAMILTLAGAVAMSGSALAGGSGGCSHGAFGKWHADKSDQTFADNATTSSEQTATKKQ